MATKTKCSACGTEGPTRAYDYCQSCIDRHKVRDLRLGSCEGCDILDYHQSEEENGGDTNPGA